MARNTASTYRRPEGHYREVRPGVWRIWFNVPQASGRRKQRTMTVRGSEVDANHSLRETLSALHTNDYSEPSKLTVAALLDLWLNVYASQKRPSTYRGYEANVRLYLAAELGHMLLARLDTSDIEAAYARIRSRGLSKRTVLYAHRVLHKALQYAVRRKFIKVNPAGRDYMDVPPTPKSNARALGGVERHTFLSALDDEPWLSSPWYTLFNLAYYTGLRRGELMGLTWDAVDLQHRLLSVTQTLNRVSNQGLKTGEPKSRSSRRAITLSSTIVRILQEHRIAQTERRLKAGPAWDGRGFIFTGLDGHPLDPDSASKAFHRLMRQLDIAGVTLHSLRHTHATVLVENDVHLKVIQARLGHESIQITADTYAHVARGLDEAAAETFDKAVSGSYR